MINKILIIIHYIIYYIYIKKNIKCPIYIIFYSLFFGARQNAANPWNEYADTLEWTLPSPPPEHTFEILPEQKDWDKSEAH